VIGTVEAGAGLLPPEHAESSAASAPTAAAGRAALIRSVCLRIAPVSQRPPPSARRDIDP
jgi:hypothetical protein